MFEMKPNAIYRKNLNTFQILFKSHFVPLKNLTKLLAFCRSVCEPLFSLKSAQKCLWCHLARLLDCLPKSVYLIFYVKFANTLFSLDIRFRSRKFEVFKRRAGSLDCSNAPKLATSIYFLCVPIFQKLLD